jgi:uncharacterized protein YhdP
VAKTHRRLVRFFLRLILRFVLYGVLVFCLLTTAGVWSLDHYLEPEKIKPELERVVSDFLQRPVSIANVSWQWYPRPILFGTDVIVTEKDGRPLLDAPEIRLYPRLRHLLRRQIFIQGLGIHAAALTLRRYGDGSTNVERISADIAAHMQASEGREPSALSFVLRRIRVTGARLEFVDEGLKAVPLQTVMRLDGDFDFPEDDRPVTMKLRSEVLRGERRGHLAIAGSFGSRTVLEASSQDFPLPALADYAPAVGGLDVRSALSASAVITSDAVRWSIDGRCPAARLFSLGGGPALAVDFKLRSDQPSLVKASVALGNTIGEITAATPHLARPALRVHADFSALDLDEVQAALRPYLAALSHSAAGMQKSRDSVPWSLVGNLAVARGDCQRVHFNDLSAVISRDEAGAWRAEAATPRLSVRGESFALSTAVVSYHDGDLSILEKGFSGLGGRGDLEFSLTRADAALGQKEAEGLGRRFDFAWDVAEIDSSRLLASCGLRPLSTGRLRSKGRLSGDRTALLSGQLKGAFQVELASGAISGLPGVLKVLSSLNVRSLFNSVEGKNVRGLPFRVVSASCAVDAGLLRTTSPAALHSDTMDMGLMGSIDLAKDTIQADMVVQFLTFFNEIVRLVPGVKHILIGKKKSVLPLWVKISGPLDDPEVKVQPVKSLRKELWSAVKGVFTLPEDVFSTLTGVGRQK